jgi:hypothetical protein
VAFIARPFDAGSLVAVTLGCNRTMALTCTSIFGTV